MVVYNRQVTPQTITQEETQEIQRAFITKVFGWMSAGLCITGIFAMLTMQSQAMLDFIFGNRMIFFGLMIAEIGLVVWLSARIQKMSAATATLVFMGYTALTGLTLSVVFLAYTAASLTSTFFITAGTFGAMSIYGYTTQRDLSGFGSFLMMGLIGMVIASVVNMFFNNETVYWLTTYIGVFIFVGLTAYDMQKMKYLSLSALEGGEVEQKLAIFGALTLYLDFINLFLLLLRVLGRRK